MIEQMLSFCKRRMYFAEEFCLPIIASVGTHVLQQKNKEGALMYANGKKERVNTGLCIVSPSGFSKSLALSTVLDKETGLIPSITTVFVLKLTESGLVGSFDENGNIVRGLAYEKPNAYIVTEELSNIMNPKDSEDVKLVNALLTGASEGYIHKRLKGGEISYPTNFTFSGATQPIRQRFELSSGACRRFVFVFKAWNLHDIKKIKGARLKFKKIGTLTEQEKELRNEIEARINTPVTRVEVDEKLLKYIQKMSNVHTEGIKLEKMAMGYSFWLQDSIKDGVLTVSRSRAIKKFLRIIRDMADGIYRGPELTLLRSIISSNNGKDIDRDVLFRTFGGMGYNEYTVSDLLIRYRDFIKSDGHKLWVREQAT